MTKAEGDHLGTGNHPGTTPSRSEVSCALSDLLLRVEGATGADRALDAAIEHATRFHRGLQLGLKPEHIAVWRHVGNGEVESQGTRYASPAYTGSLDAALALVTRVLPGWQVTLGQHRAPGKRGDLWKASLTSPQGGGMDTGWAPTPALALLAAMLKALQQEGAATP